MAQALDRRRAPAAPAGPGRHARAVLLAVAFIAAYCGLDRIGAGLAADSAAPAPWDLAGGLALALLIIEGPQLAPAVALAEVLASWLGLGEKLDWPVALGEAVVLAAVYAGAAAILRRGGIRRIASQQDLLRFSIVVAAAAAVRAVATLGLGGDWSLPPRALGSELTRHFTGDVVGAVVVTPLVAGLRRPGRLRAARWLEIALLATLLAGVMIYALPPRGDDRFRLFYLLFLPQIWIAVRFGAAGAVLGNLAVQIGLIAYLILSREDAHMVFNFQFRLLALALSMLFLGVAVSERRGAEAQLRARQETLARVARLSLAGEMAGGLAHELNQPLLAIMAFTRSAQRLADDPAARDRFDAALEGAVAQAERAGAIVKSLRRFIDRSESERGRHALSSVIGDALALVRPQGARAGVRLVSALGRDLPKAWVDPVQMQQVVLNLVQNAIESLSRDEEGAKTVRIGAEARADGGLEVEVRDTGRGVAADTAASLFGPFSGDKASGMGLGLLISRGIVEGHGGRLWLAQNEPGACAFRFSLPPPPRT